MVGSRSLLLLLLLLLRGGWARRHRRRRRDGLGQDLAEAVEGVGPQGPPLGDPAVDLGEGADIELATAHPADLLGAHDAGRLEHLDVLHDGGQ